MICSLNGEWVELQRQELATKCFNERNLFSIDHIAMPFIANCLVSPDCDFSSCCFILALLCCLLGVISSAIFVVHWLTDCSLCLVTKLSHFVQFILDFRNGFCLEGQHMLQQAYVSAVCGSHLFLILLDFFRKKNILHLPRFFSTLSSYYIPIKT